MTKLLPLREVRETLAIHRNTLNKYIRTGKIPVVTMPGGQKRIKLAALQAFIDERECGVHTSQHKGESNGRQSNYDR